MTPWLAPIYITLGYNLAHLDMLVLVLTVAMSAFAQITTGTLSGAVTDAQGGAISGATRDRDC